MAKASDYLDKISGYFFLAGFALSKFKIIPVYIISFLFNISSLLAYLIGYTAWFLASLIYPNQPREKSTWYGFAEFKDQYQIAAMLGTTATIVCLINPTLILPGVWLFALSNMAWSIAEYHKYKQPPRDDPHYSTLRQIQYLRYVLLSTTISLLTATTTTIAFFCPPVSFIILLSAGIIANGLTFIALYYWKKCTFDPFAPDSKPALASYNQMQERLGSNPALVDQPGSDPKAPGHYAHPVYLNRPPQDCFQNIDNHPSDTYNDLF